MTSIHEQLAPPSIWDLYRHAESKTSRETTHPHTPLDYLSIYLSIYLGGPRGFWWTGNKAIYFTGSVSVQQNSKNEGTGNRVIKEILGNRYTPPPCPLPAHTHTQCRCLHILSGPRRSLATALIIPLVSARYIICLCRLLQVFALSHDCCFME